MWRSKMASNNRQRQQRQKGRASMDNEIITDISKKRSALSRRRVLASGEETSRKIGRGRMVCLYGICNNKCGVKRLSVIIEASADGGENSNGAAMT
jgi:hypothetical protein